MRKYPGAKDDNATARSVLSNAQSDAGDLGIVYPDGPDSKLLNRVEGAPTGPGITHDAVRAAVLSTFGINVGRWVRQRVFEARGWLKQPDAAARAESSRSA